MKNRSAFTLIELLVVIAIIGLLATLSVLALNNARAKSRDTKRIADIKQMQTALELYFNDASAYPVSVGAGGSITSYNSSTGATTTYMQMVPTPPTPPTAITPYTYELITGAGASYTLEYCLEGSVATLAAGCHTATNSAL
jgi:prepilin-type N-terminal cleavage/methylation domain-containing protein